MHEPWQERRFAADGQSGGRAGRPRILVLGAGYGGLTCFLELQDQVPRRTDLVLVNADEYHWFTTELHTYIAGQEAESIRVPLRRVVHRPGRLVVGRVSEVDPAGSLVMLADGQALPYDYLVFALGSDPEYYGLPGAEEHSLVVGNSQGARALRDRIAAVASRETVPGPADGDPLPHVVVAGGGLTGVEVAGELADEHLGRISLTIVEAAPEILAGFDPDLVQSARDVLEGKGIRIRTGSPITRVDNRTIYFADGQQLECDLLIWAGGVRGSGVLARSGLVITPRGRGEVDQFLRARGYPQIYLVGDSAAFTMPATGRELPPTAQAAVQMGRAAARNLLNRMRGRPEEPFSPQLRGAFASLGREQGVGQIGTERFKGAPAVVIKHLIEAHHAYETGAGVLPLVKRILQAPGRLLGARRPRAKIVAPSRVGREQPGERPTLR